MNGLWHIDVMSPFHGAGMLRPSIPLACLFLMGCAPATLNPRVNPVGPVARWQHGEGFVEQTIDGVTVGLAHFNSGVNRMEFTVEILNGGPAPLELRPQGFTCSLEAPHDPRRGAQDVQAQDPEAKLRALEQSKAWEQKRQSDASTASGFFFLLDIADSAAHDRKRSPEQLASSNQSKQDFYRDRENERRQAQEAEARITDQQNREAGTLLRQHTLAPGERIKGRVEFRLDVSQHRRLRVKVPVAGRGFEFEFKVG